MEDEAAEVVEDEETAEVDDAVEVDEATSEVDDDETLEVDETTSEVEDTVSDVDEEMTSEVDETSDVDETASEVEDTASEVDEETTSDADDETSVADEDEDETAEVDENSEVDETELEAELKLVSDKETWLVDDSTGPELSAADVVEDSIVDDKTILLREVDEIVPHVDSLTIDDTELLTLGSVSLGTTFVAEHGGGGGGEGQVVIVLLMMTVTMASGGLVKEWTSLLSTAIAVTPEAKAERVMSDWNERRGIMAMLDWTKNERQRCDYSSGLRIVDRLAVGESIWKILPHGKGGPVEIKTWLLHPRRSPIQ